MVVSRRIRFLFGFETLLPLTASRMVGDPHRAATYLRKRVNKSRHETCLTNGRSTVSRIIANPSYLRAGRGPFLRQSLAGGEVRVPRETSAKDVSRRGDFHLHPSRR